MYSFHLVVAKRVLIYLQYQLMPLRMWKYYVMVLLPSMALMRLQV